MKKETREVMVPTAKIVYIASDGKEFESENACNQHENELEKKSLSTIEQCDELENYPPPNGGNNFCEDNTFKWYLPKTVEEMDLLRNVFIDCPFSDENIGKWHCIEDSTDFDSWVTVVDEVDAYITDVYEKLGFTVNIIDNNKGITNERLKMLLDEVTELSVIAPEVGECSDEEEELLEEIANLRMALEDYLEV